MPTVGIVLPTASYRGPDFITAADELGIDLVLVTDGSLALASGRITGVIEADCTDPETAAGALVAASDGRLDAVIGVDDGGVLIAAIAAERLGLPHNSSAAVAATRDKLEMRRLLEAAGIRQPVFRWAEPGFPVASVAAEIGYPVVIKPRSLSGSRGVIKATLSAEIEEVARRVRSIQAEAGMSEEGLLVEAYLPGDEVAVEGLLGPQGLEVLAVFDKPDPLEGPFFEETVYVTPSRHLAVVVEETCSLVEEACRALGLAFGPVHAEVRLSPDGPAVIEVAARSIGGLCGRSLRFGMLEQSLEVLLLRAALGMNRRGMRPSERASGAMMIPISHAGVLRHVGGIAATSEVPGVEEVTITVPVGRRIRPLPEGDRYLGFIIARGEFPAEVEASLREAHSLLEIEIE